MAGLHQPKKMKYVNISLKIILLDSIPWYQTKLEETDGVYSSKWLIISKDVCYY